MPDSSPSLSWYSLAVLFVLRCSVSVACLGVLLWCAVYDITYNSDLLQHRPTLTKVVCSGQAEADHCATHRAKALALPEPLWRCGSARSLGPHPSLGLPSGCLLLRAGTEVSPHACSSAPGKKKLAGACWGPVSPLALGPIMECVDRTAGAYLLQELYESTE